MANKSHPAPASIDPLLVDCEGGQEECADVEVDKAQTQDSIVAKGPVREAKISKRTCDAREAKVTKGPARKAKVKILLPTEAVVDEPDKEDLAGQAGNGEGGQVGDGGDGDRHPSMLHYL